MEVLILDFFVRIQATGMRWRGTRNLFLLFNFQTGSPWYGDVGIANSNLCFAESRVCKAECAKQSAIRRCACRSYVKDGVYVDVDLRFFVRK